MTDFKPVIQVLRLEEKESEFRGKQWHFDLSDGKKFFPGILGRPMLEELAHNSSIEEYSIIRVSKFEVELESFTNGGRYCSIFEAEVVGPNPGRIIGKPIWLADDVLQRIDGMEYRATSYASKVLQQTTVNAEEVRNLLRPRGSGDLPSKLLKRITDGFKEGTRGLQLQLALGPTENCSTIKDSDGITTIHNWFVMLASIAKMNKNYIAASMEMTLRPILNLFWLPPELYRRKNITEVQTTISYRLQVYSGLSQIWPRPASLKGRAKMMLSLTLPAVQSSGTSTETPIMKFNTPSVTCVIRALHSFDMRSTLARSNTKAEVIESHTNLRMNFYRLQICEFAQATPRSAPACLC